MVKGDMCLKVVEQGKHKDVPIKEGEVKYDMQCYDEWFDDLQPSQQLFSHIKPMER